jgi:NTE family protein
MTIYEADAVFQGVGVKGLALVGALREFTDNALSGHSGPKWMKVADTNAGAIIAAYLGSTESRS